MHSPDMSLLTNGFELELPILGSKSYWRIESFCKLVFVELCITFLLVETLVLCVMGELGLELPVLGSKS